MRKIAVVAATGLVVLVSGCGKNVDSADHLLERLDTDARITCPDKQVTQVDDHETVTCNTSGVATADAFTITIFDDQEQLAETLAQGSDVATVTGFNWLITSPSLQTARMIRAVVGGHLRSSVEEGKSALEE